MMSEEKQMMTARMGAGVLLLLLVAVMGGVQGKLVDLKPFHNLIIKEHNQLRREVFPKASNMREIIWDEEVARHAEEWAEYCRYERPPSYMYNSGSNLAYSRYHVHAKSPASVRANLRQGLQSWSKERRSFKYKAGCDHACSYAQMIHGSTHRMGCAMNTCSRLRVGSSMESYSTLFVCLYAPKVRLMTTYPYLEGKPCSACPSGTHCSKGLCAEKAGMAAPVALVASLTSSDGAVRYGPPEPSSVVAVSRSPTRVKPWSTDKLSNSEVDFLLQIQNMFRAEAGHPKLRWDKYLNRWCDWIINCDIDYPGPPHTYANFHRVFNHTPIYDVVYEWRKEGMNANVQLEKGCRTPYDHTECNHFTNMMQHELTLMACAAKGCKDGTRQLLCLYDGPNDKRTP